MSPLLLFIPFAAVAVIILVSVGVRPVRVVALWLAVLALLGALSLVGGSAAPDSAATAALAPTYDTRTASEV